MSTSAVEILQQDSVAQSSLSPQSTDMYPYLTRYIFVPFKTNKKLSPYYKSLYNLPNGLQQGIIQRIEKFDRSEVDHDAVTRVPTDRWGFPVATDYGVTEMKRDTRRPDYVVDAILRSYNPNYVSQGMENNGILEVVPMRGIDDRRLHEELQGYFLPEIYSTAREQIEQLDKAIAAIGSRPKIFQQVGEVLMRATVMAVEWGMMKYGRIQASVEEYGRTGKSGKRELSKFDKHLCAWLEAPEPKLQSMLAGLQNLQQQTRNNEPSIAQHTCPDCGNRINLLPDGSLPRKGCIACGWNPGEVKTATSVQEKFDPADPMGEVDRLTRKQAEMRERNGK